MAMVSESEYKGNPMIVLKNSENDKYPFQFGLKKARLILDSVEDIRKFIAKHGDAKKSSGDASSEAAESNI